ALMAADLAQGVRTGLYAQLCGDAHLSNFGVFATPDRRLTFDVNDFDETLPGPFEWDIKRLVASFAVAGRDQGFAPRVRTRICAPVVRSYRRRCTTSHPSAPSICGTREPTSTASYSPFGRRSPRPDTKQIKRDLTKARTRTSLKAFAKLTRV